MRSVQKVKDGIFSVWNKQLLVLIFKGMLIPEPDVSFLKSNLLPIWLPFGRDQSLSYFKSLSQTERPCDKNIKY